MANTVLTLQELASITANTPTDAIDCLLYKEIGIELAITNVSGTNPTMDVVIQHQSGLNTTDWHTLYTFAQKTTTGTSSVYIPNGTQFGFLRNLRATLTIGGTDTPNFTLSIVIIAKE